MDNIKRLILTAVSLLVLQYCSYHDSPISVQCRVKQRKIKQSYIHIL